MNRLFVFASLIAALLTSPFTSMAAAGPSGQLATEDFMVTILMERNRLSLFETVQEFLDHD